MYQLFNTGSYDQPVQAAACSTNLALQLYLLLYFLSHIYSAHLVLKLYFHDYDFHAIPSDS